MRGIALSVAALAWGGCGDHEVVRPRDCGVQGPIDLLEVGDDVRQIAATPVGERVLVELEDDDKVVTWSVDRCGDDALRLMTSARDASRTRYGRAGTHAVRCDPSTGALDWVDPYGERPPHRLFDDANNCAVWAVAGGLAALDAETRELQYVGDPADASIASVSLMIAGEGDPIGVLWPEPDRFENVAQGPKVVGDRLVLNDAEGRFVELDPVSGSLRVIFERSAREFRVLQDGRRVLWHSWCSGDEPSSACSGTQIWDPETGASSRVAPIMRISRMAEPWIALDVPGYFEGDAAKLLRAYNIETTAQQEPSMQLVAPPRRDDSPWIPFQPWTLLGSPSPEVLLLAIPSDPFDVDEPEDRYLYWPETGERRVVDFPDDPQALKTEAGLLSWAGGRIHLLPQDLGPARMVANTAVEPVFTPTGQVAAIVADALQLFEPDGSSTRLDDEVTHLYAPRHPRGAAANADALYYVASGMLRQVPLP